MLVQTLLWIRQEPVSFSNLANYHAGEQPDSRSIKICTDNKIYSIKEQKARQIRLSDFTEFDFILVMDKDNLRNVLKKKPLDSTAQSNSF